MTRAFFLAACLVLSGPALAEKGVQSSIADLGFLIGTWEGRSTFFYPRDPERETTHEETQADCMHILKDTYIQCDAEWTRTDGRVRTLRIHFTYDETAGDYPILILYDDWSGQVTYPLHYAEARRAYIGESNFEHSDGRAGKERVEWSVSADGSEVRSAEFNHYETEPDGYWPKTFEFVWRKVE